MRRLVLLPVVIAALAGCGGGERVSQTRDVAPYTRLDVEGGIDVQVVPGQRRAVVVTGGSEVIDRVLTDSSGGTLRVAIKDRGIVIGPDPFDDVRVEIPAATLEAIRVHGSADLRLGGIDTEELALELEGAGEVEASGSVERLIATIEGAGDAHLADLVARTARVTVEGAGEAELHVTDELDVTVEGAGDVTYRGRPLVRQTVEGAGEVSPAE